MPTPSPLDDRDSFEDAVFTGLDLAAADFSERIFERCAFRKLPLQESVWTNARLHDCVFDGCDLTRIKATKLALRGFGHSDLTGSRFERCDLRKADFADARGVHFDPVKNTVKGAKISLATAVLLASAAGLRVSGFDDDADK